MYALYPMEHGQLTTNYYFQVMRLEVRTLRKIATFTHCKLNHFVAFFA